MGYNKTPVDRRKEANERNEARNNRTITEQLELIAKRPGKSEKEVRKLYQQMKENEKGNKKKRERTSKAHSS
jgi:hypothetical protein